MPAPERTLATVGYEGATIAAVIEALGAAGVTTLVDVRAVASSRRPGFSKSRLAANLDEAGIRYVHLRALGTPAAGRAAARAGRHAEMHEIFARQLATFDAQAALHELIELVEGPGRVCVLCFEADPAHCHRTLVAEAVRARTQARVLHLRPGSAD